MSEIKREVKDLLQKMKNKIIEHGVEPELTEFEAIAEVERLQSQVAEKDKEIAELRAALEFALIYDPDIDKYKIKHTVWPKLKKALQNTKREG